MDFQPKWIPWKRYVLALTVDGGRTLCLGRFMRRERPDREAERLDMYKGYRAWVVDTKKQVDRLKETKGEKT